MSTRSFSDDDLIEVLKSMTNSQAAKHFDVSKRQIERRLSRSAEHEVRCAPQRARRSGTAHG
ncbi:hypothetical protein [Pseudomonas aeruginosa]|uniref:hypothetical protein n=1 Tax=Pseudomonas aeruginosa TaxID=287 RepID=UPI001F04BAC9|nr:hypothetical protein [Pseudomonas aeruginosa]